ncbi:MAG TPA: type II toxin-antitoxin system RelE/ParE family toxin [bacterium]|mgnify:CR=1 FL=1|nr:type II toxin-antitoxin system RelE/ParE family toxin [bacterium]
MNIVFSESAAKEMAAIVRASTTDRSYAGFRSAEEWKRLLRQPAEEPVRGRIVPEFADERLREIIDGPFRLVYIVDVYQDLATIVAVHLRQPSVE